MKLFRKTAVQETGRFFALFGVFFYIVLPVAFAVVDNQGIGSDLLSMCGGTSIKHIVFDQEAGADTAGTDTGNPVDPSRPSNSSQPVRNAKIKDGCPFCTPQVFAAIVPPVPGGEAVPRQVPAITRWPDSNQPPGDKPAEDATSIRGPPVM